MLKYLLTLIFIIPFFSDAQAQSATDTAMYYVKNDGSFVENKDEADYVLFIMPETQSGKQKLYPVLAFYPDGKRKMIATSGFKSKKLSFEGTQLMFFPNGKRSAVTMYEKGEPVGEQITYYPNGKLYTRKNFQKKKILLIECRDSTGVVLAENGNGKWVDFDNIFRNITAQGPVIDGLMDGDWYETYRVITYKKGVSNNPWSFTMIGGRNTLSKEDNYMSLDTNSIYKNKLDTMEKFIATNINYPILIKENALDRQMYVGFFVGTDGSMTSFSTFFSPSKAMADELIRVTKLSAPWRSTNTSQTLTRTPVILPVYFPKDSLPYDSIGYKALGTILIQPNYPGGPAAFTKFLEKNVRYPLLERELTVMGKVLTSFVVEKDGSVTDIHVLTAPSIGLAEESIRVMRHSPNWSPGIMNGNPIRVKYTIPINYTLGFNEIDTRTSDYLEPIDLPGRGNIRDSLEKFIIDNIEEPIKKEIVGKQIYVEISINSGGLLNDLKVVGSPSEKLTRELNRVVKSSFPWPLIYGGETVLPIYFSASSLKMSIDSVNNKLTNPNRQKIFTSAEKPPEFPGGARAFTLFLERNVKYPSREKDLNIQGKVYATFIVEKDGSMSEMHITRTPSIGLAEDVLRVLKRSPNWSPGLVNFKPVRVRYTVPINYTLGEDEITPSKNRVSKIVAVNDSVFIRTASGNAYVKPEIMPKFPGGVFEFAKFLSSNIKYSKVDRQNNAYGRVKMSFIVETDGTISNIESTQSPTKTLGEEAIRVMKISPKWSPGSEKQRNVRVLLNITFQVEYKNNDTSIILNNPY